MTFLEELLDLQVPQEIRISPNAQQVLYSTALVHRHKKDEHAQLSLWLAETGKAKSARKLTSGLHNDSSPRWFPDGKTIAFLSDRHDHGKKFAVYALDTTGGEAYPLTSTETEQPVDAFEISPDGKWIAFISADEKTEERKAKEKAKDDVKVWGEDWLYHRLRLMHVATKKVTTLFDQDAHVRSLAWQDKGKKIAFFASRNPDLESYFLGNAIFVADVASSNVQLASRVPSWTANPIFVGDKLYFNGPAVIDSTESSVVVYSLDFDQSPPPLEKVAYGEENCAAGLRGAGGDVTVLVQHGMEDQVRMLDGKTLLSKRQRILAWDAAFTKDSDELIVAIGTGDANKPTEVYTTTASGGALIQVSTHGEALQGKKFGKASFFSCRSKDDKEDLDAMWITPVDDDAENETTAKPKPTIVLIHGGPYYRLTDAFDVHFCWQPLLLSKGYSILVPNYRGGSGRGERFAAYARGGCGIYDHADVIAITDEAVKKGLADKDHLIVAGWSQGGFLSYMCSVRNGLQGLGWKFRAAIPGAGVVDDDTMCFVSDVGTVQGELAGLPPWKMKKDDVSSRSGSAIWEFADAVEKGGVIPPVLILHGENDLRVGVEQAVAFRRALESAGLPFEMALYPREPHTIKERKHLVDMGERVLRFIDKHMGL